MTKKTKLTFIIFIFCLCLLCNSCGHKDNKTPDENQDETPNNQNEYTPSDYEYIEMSDGTLSINAYIGETDSTTLTIPTYINEKKVTAISDYAFANNSYGNNTIKTIIIPSTIKSIGKCAFYNSDYIEKIEFEESSELTTIGEYAFSMMENLHTIQIPNEVNLIEQNAFLYSGITKINTGNNKNYKWEDGFLLDQNVYDKTKRIAIYVDPTMKEVVVPNNVDQLNSELFKNNQNIISIDLNNITHIGVECFANSTLEQVIGGTNVTGSDKNAFLGTKWLNNQNTEYVKIGSVLLEYIGNETKVVIPDDITRIGENCFSGYNIKTIILPKTIEVIGENAFTNCLNLEYILLTPSRPPIINGTIARKNIKIYVNTGDYKYYQSSIYYQNIKTQISTKSFKITFNDINGNYLGEKEEIYGSTFDNYILDKIKGMKFLYWEDEEKNKYYINYIIDAYEDIILTPIYE